MFLHQSFSPESFSGKSFYFTVVLVDTGKEVQIQVGGGGGGGIMASRKPAAMEDREPVLFWSDERDFEDLIMVFEAFRRVING